MTPKNKWDLFKVLQTLQDNMNRVFEKSLIKQMGASSINEGGTWKPVVDIFEDDKEFVINAELPGLTDKDVQIKVDNNTLILIGERKFSFNVKEENYHRLERVYGGFRRDFALSSNVDIDRIAATFKEGLLTITLPKIEDAKTKKIEISSK